MGSRERRRKGKKGWQAKRKILAASIIEVTFYDSPGDDSHG
jgi:hypothetical protein